MVLKKKQELRLQPSGWGACLAFTKRGLISSVTLNQAQRHMAPVQYSRRRSKKKQESMAILSSSVFEASLSYMRALSQRKKKRKKQPVHSTPRSRSCDFPLASPLILRSFPLVSCIKGYSRTAHLHIFPHDAICWDPAGASVNRGRMIYTVNLGGCASLGLFCP